MRAWWADGRQASDWRDATRSTICGMEAAAAAAVVTTGGDALVSLSGGADCGRLPEQGKEGGKSAGLPKGGRERACTSRSEALRYANAIIGL